LSELLNVDEAVRRVLEQVSVLSSENAQLTQVLNRVLAQDIVAAENLPPFANSSMDGYAVHAADTLSASPQTPVSLPVVMDIPAGTAPQQPLNAGEAARIMTGAPLPLGADAVIPVEDTDGNWRAGIDIELSPQVKLFKSVSIGANVRPIGESVRQGETVLRAGTVLRAQDIGMLASLGVAVVPVYRRPRVAIISTGDELVDAHEALSPGKIRDANRYAIAALVQEYGGEALPLPIARDTLDAVRGVFRDAIDSGADIIVSSAGVSVGTYDVVRAVLDELGKVDFWRVNIRPGKPLAFGQLEGIPFFGLPGNPVSALVTFDVFVRPTLLKLAGRSDDARTAIAVTGADMRSDGRRSYIRVRLVRENGRLTAYETGTQSSGALMSMVLADGLLIIPEGVTHAPAGSEYPVRLLRRFDV
jgi:molybdopterin molybdotransferase